MQINNIGYNHVHDADFIIKRPSGSGDYLLVLLKSPAVFTLNGEDTITESNSFILYRKGMPQFYRAYGSRFSNDWFHFEMSDDDLKFIVSLSIPFDEVKILGDINDLSLIIKNMCYERYSSNKYKDDSVRLYMRLFFLKLAEKMSSVSRATHGSYYEKMSMIRTNIYNKPYDNWTIQGMSHQLTMSESYFQHLYKKIFGTGVMNDVIQSRVEHAKYLLSTTDISIEHISQMCGYNSSSHFMRQFKKETGMRPSDYRKTIIIIDKL